MIHTEPTKASHIETLIAAAWDLRSKDPQRALATATEAVQLARGCAGTATYAAARCMQGVCASILSRYEEAHEALTESLEISRQCGDLDTESRCLHYLGIIHYNLAEYADAGEKVRASLQIREDREDWEGLGAGFNVLGNIQYNLCDYAQALDWYVRGLQARERASDQFGVMGSLCNIGNVYAERGEHLEALRYHQRALDQATRLENPSYEMISLSAIGSDYADLGRYDEGIAVCRRAITLGETLESWNQVGAALTSLGFAYNKTRRRTEALDAYTQALALARTVQDGKVEAHALYAMGDILADAGELTEARAKLAEASALAVKIGAKRTAFLAFQMLSRVCKRSGDYAAALGHFESFQRLEKEVFTEEAADRAKSLVIQMEVEHHRREAETLSEINTALQVANARLEALAVTDPLTDLPNHRALIAALDAATARTRRDGEPCALLFLDIDHFKSVNDTYGHPVGDAVLREFADCTRASLREEDTLGRWGGEEFLALLPGTDLAEALAIGERVREAISDILLSAGGGLHLTCSIGISACPSVEAKRDALVESADRALYAAKRLGRNQVRGINDPALLALDGGRGEAGASAGPRLGFDTLRHPRV